ncbi:MAG: hypothetical protein OIF56_05140 [Cohaesibacter sp.]|nr:hypothetical protein [Cohaesibacter sp.]
MRRIPFGCGGGGKLLLGAGAGRGGTGGAVFLLNTALSSSRL